MSTRRFYLVGFGLLLAFDTLAQLSFKWAGLHGGEPAFDLPWLLRVFASPGSTAPSSATSAPSSPG